MDMTAENDVNMVFVEQRSPLGSDIGVILLDRIGWEMKNREFPTGVALRQSGVEPFGLFLQRRGDIQNHEKGVPVMNAVGAFRFEVVRTPGTKPPERFPGTKPGAIG